MASHFQNLKRSIKVDSEKIQTRTDYYINIIDEAIQSKRADALQKKYKGMYKYYVSTIIITFNLDTKIINIIISFLVNRRTSACKWTYCLCKGWFV